MNELEISQYITETFAGVNVLTDADNSFFIYDPEKNLPPKQQMPFVTLVVNDRYDQFSQLDRPGIFRLNIGISKQTFRSLFDTPALPVDRENAAVNDETGKAYDFATLDRIMPHPEYGRMFWVCVLNPGEETFETQVRQFLNEAYDLAVSKYQRRTTLK